MGKILEEMKQRRNEVKDGRWRVSFRLARYASGWIISECAIIRPESRRLSGRDASLEFPVGLGTATWTGSWWDCLCGREVPCFARAPNQQSACSKKDGSHSVQD